MELPITKKIILGKVNDLLSNKRGIYFWYDKRDNSLVYIGIAVGNGGLKKRIAQQHLNPNYLEYRDDKHTKKDGYQLKYAVRRISKTSGEKKFGIDKSAFRKAIGRSLSLKPGFETTEYIKQNLRLEIYESEDIDLIKSMEKHLIMHFQPKLNGAHKGF